LALPYANINNLTNEMPSYL